jgi:hypothetical protein
MYHLATLGGSMYVFVEAQNVERQNVGPQNVEMRDVEEHFFFPRISTLISVLLACFGIRVTRSQSYDFLIYSYNASVVVG